MKRLFSVFAALLFFLPFNANAQKNTTDGELKVISYNIRLGSGEDGTNSWAFRYEASSAMINDQKPDIFGLQEAFEYQKKYLEETCKGYKAIGVGREDGRHKGEIMAIFYNKKTVSCKKWGTFWLSETPDKPSKGWDAACYRTATWALMKHKASGRKFFYVNTHLDHVGEVARQKGLELIMSRIAEINPEGYPLVLTGDFNIQSNHPTILAQNKAMTNAREVAPVTDRKGTFNNWGKEKKAMIIDYIYYTGFSECKKYETITKPYCGRNFISDHFPITATLVF